MSNATTPHIRIFDRVRWSDHFMHDTGQWDNGGQHDPAPCHWGKHARGTVMKDAHGDRKLVHVRWDDGTEGRVKPEYLTVVQPHPDADLYSVPRGPHE